MIAMMTDEPNTTLIHPMALVESDSIGEGCRVWAWAHVMQGAVLGDNCNIGEHCFIESGARVGNRVVIKNDAMVWEGVTLEDDVFIGPRVTFTNDKYPRSRWLESAWHRYDDKRWISTTIVRRGASIGAAAVILPGLVIGEYALVGAGATVTASVPTHAVVVGSPARLVGWVCACGQRLILDALDTAVCVCGREFRRPREALIEQVPRAASTP